MGCLFDDHLQPGRQKGYRRDVQQPADVRRLKRRSSRAVIAGVVEMAVAMVVSVLRMAPPVVTTIGWLVGFVLVLYGVHVGWMVFYDREPEGPSS